MSRNAAGLMTYHIFVTVLLHLYLHIQFAYWSLPVLQPDTERASYDNAF